MPEIASPSIYICRLLSISSPPCATSRSFTIDSFRFHRHHQITLPCLSRSILPFSISPPTNQTTSTSSSMFNTLTITIVTINIDQLPGIVLMQVMIIVLPYPYALYSLVNLHPLLWYHLHLFSAYWPLHSVDPCTSPADQHSAHSISCKSSS